MVGGLLAAIAATTSGCFQDRVGPCRNLYAHLQTLSSHQPDPTLEQRFVEACVAAWDERRVTCLQEATTPEQALECKRQRVRPT